MIVRLSKSASSIQTKIDSRHFHGRVIIVVFQHENLSNGFLFLRAWISDATVSAAAVLRSALTTTQERNKRAKYYRTTTVLDAPFFFTAFKLRQSEGRSERLFLRC